MKIPSRDIVQLRFLNIETHASLVLNTLKTLFLNKEFEYVKKLIKLFDKNGLGMPRTIFQDLREDQVKYLTQQMVIVTWGGFRPADDRYRQLTTSFEEEREAGLDGDMLVAKLRIDTKTGNGEDANTMPEVTKSMDANVSPSKASLERSKASQLEMLQLRRAGGE